MENSGTRHTKKPRAKASASLGRRVISDAEASAEASDGKSAASSSSGVSQKRPTIQTFDKHTRALRILDPACGSGSFLIRAFERVCEHWQRRFKLHPDDRRKELCWVDPVTDDVHLTVDLKRRILRDNIYGVDLDAQAVEVTQLSLYLKMLEGEDRTSLQWSSPEVVDALSAVDCC